MPRTTSDRIGNSTPQKTANSSATNSRLLNRKVASRDTTDSSRWSARSSGSRHTIIGTENPTTNATSASSQEPSVHRRTDSSQRASVRPVTSAAIANEYGTAMHTYPRYSVGGWMAMYGFCSDGSSPAGIDPAGAAANGEETNAAMPAKAVMTT